MQRTFGLTMKGPAMNKPLTLLTGYPMLLISSFCKKAVTALRPFKDDIRPLLFLDSKEPPVEPCTLFFKHSRLHFATRFFKQ